MKDLTITELAKVRETAMGRVLNGYHRPTRDEFRGYTYNRYGSTIPRVFVVLCFVVLLAAFVPSAVRLYSIGSFTFGSAMEYKVAYGKSTVFVGLATVLSAEVGQVIFSLALATLGTTTTSRRLLYTSMALTTMVALVGNAQVAMPGHWNNPFAYFEAFAPPLLVLSTSYVLKEQILHSVQSRLDDEHAYQESKREYSRLTADPTLLPEWSEIYAVAIWEALERKNRRNGGKFDSDAFTAEQRIQLVAREMTKSRWASRAALEEILVAQSVPAVQDGEKWEVNGGFYFRSPYTDKEYGPYQDSQMRDIQYSGHLTREKKKAVDRAATNGKVSESALGEPISAADPLPN